MARMGRGNPAPNKEMLTRTLILMGVFGILTFLILAVQLFNIQILNHEMYEQRAIQQQLRATEVSASRGTIFDSTGMILAQSASVENIFISPNDIRAHGDDAALIARGLANILDVDEAVIFDRIQNLNTYFQTVKNHVEREEADLVREFIVEHQLRGIHLVPSTRRYYPRERTAAHVLGFVGAEGSGMGYGVEGRYDDLLSGVSGRVVRLKNARGVDMLGAGFENYYAAQPGHDLHLTIDVNIQQIMEKHISQAIEDFDLQGGAFAIAKNPRTGAILGQVSMEDFDPNNHSSLRPEQLEALRERHPDDEEFHAAVNQALLESWRDKTITYTYEPGSTFKLITLAIALEEGIVCLNENRFFYCSGSKHVPGRTEPLNCARRSGHGAQTLMEAMQQSCNPATVELALEIGPERFFEYLQAFGLFERTGIDLYGEMVGHIWSEEMWNFYVSNGNFSSLAAASFGQTFTLSPIRLATITSALVNGGYIVEPFVVERVVAEDGTVILENTTTVRRQVISRETSEAVLKVMEKTVSDAQRGTGRNAAVEGFRIGGKTGTSTDTVLEAQGQVQYIVSFVSAAPIEDPELVILVSLQNPGPRATAAVSGGQMAAPVVGRMWAEILPYLGRTAQSGAEGRTNAQVPHVRRMLPEEARALLEEEGFTVRIQGEGERVVDQMPQAGAMVVTGTQVILYLDETRPEDQVAVPDVIGLGYEAARNRIEEAGLFLRRSGALGQGEAVQVYRQSRRAAEIVPRGTVIEISMIDTTREGHH